MKTDDIRKPKCLRLEAEAIHEEIINGKRFGLPETALERLRERERACLTEAEEIEKKLQLIKDPEVLEMIRLYAEGKNWDRVNRRIYHYSSAQACRKRVERALEKL